MSVFDVVKGRRLETIEYEEGFFEHQFERVELAFEGGAVLVFEVGECPGCESWINVTLDSKDGEL